MRIIMQCPILSFPSFSLTLCVYFHFDFTFTFYEKQSQKNKINPKTFFKISLHFHGKPHTFSTPKHALQEALHQPQQNCLRRRIFCPTSFWSGPNIVSSSGRLRRDIRRVSRATWSFLLDSSA